MNHIIKEAARFIRENPEKFDLKTATMTASKVLNREFPGIPESYAWAAMAVVDREKDNQWVQRVELAAKDMPLVEAMRSVGGVQ